MKITSRQINSLAEITADTDEPISISKNSRDKKDGSLVVKIGKGKRAVNWVVLSNGHSMPVAPPLKAEPDAAAALSLAHKAATEAGLAELRKSS